MGKKAHSVISVNPLNTAGVPSQMALGKKSHSIAKTLAQLLSQGNTTLYCRLGQYQAITVCQGI